MSEKLSDSKLETTRNPFEIKTATDQESDKLSDSEKNFDTNKLRKAIEISAVSREQSSYVNEFETNNANDIKNHHYNTQAIKTNRYKDTIADLQAKLGPSERSFSKIIHDDRIEKLSEIASKTIARPNLILIGGIFSFVGCLIILIYAKSIGFTVPNSIFIFLFLAGYIIGIIIDLFYHFATNRKSRQKHGGKIDY